MSNEKKIPYWKIVDERKKELREDYSKEDYERMITRIAELELRCENVLSDKDFAYICHCGSVSFNLRKDYVIECHNCQSETNFSWNVKRNAVNTHIECCGSCELFKYEQWNGTGICQNTDVETTCDDYCDEWTLSRCFK